MPKAEEIKRHEMQVYDAVAEAFGSTWARYTSRFAADMIDLMFPQKGEAALDIAGGTGAAGLRLAERIGKDSRLGVDQQSDRAPRTTGNTASTGSPSSRARACALRTFPG